MNHGIPAQLRPGHRHDKHDGSDFATKGDHTEPLPPGKRSDRSSCPSGRDKAKCAHYLDCGKPAQKTALVNSSDHAIVAAFGSVCRGVVQYYLLAGYVFRLHRPQWGMETSMLKTLAAKHHSSGSKMAAKHKVRIDTPNGHRVCFEARIERKNRKPLAARFGEIPLQRQRAAELADREPVQVDYPQKELNFRRLLCDRQESMRHRFGQPTITVMDKRTCTMRLSHGIIRAGRWPYGYAMN